MIGGYIGDGIGVAPDTLTLLSFSYTGVGSALFDGAASWNVRLKVSGSGGLVFDGAVTPVTIQQLLSLTGSGGLNLGGAAWIGMDEATDIWSVQ